jgi:hypothetical protein
MPINEPNSKVTLEQLLRLKRAERPNPEFWAHFERELHQKQLTALVQKRRWWHGMSLIPMRRVLLPTGAVAIATLTFISVRQSVSPQAVETGRVPALSSSTVQEIETLSPVQVPSKAVYASLGAQVDSDATPSNHVIPVTESIPVTQESESPSARSIAANLARLEQSEPDLIHSVLGSRLSSAARVQTVAASQNASEETAGTDSSSRYRLIARYADRALSPEPLAPVGVRERIARRLGDDLGEGISRIGVVGSRVSLKF